MYYTTLLYRVSKNTQIRGTDKKIVVESTNLLAEITVTSKVVYTLICKNDCTFYNGKLYTLS